MSRLRPTYRVWQSHDATATLVPLSLTEADRLPPTTSEPTTAAGSRVRQLSLEQKLPLLMTAVLVIVLTVSLALTERTLTRSAQDAVAVRLARAKQQLATSMRLGLFSLLLIIASAGASWLISTRITRPLAALSAAA